MRKVIAGTVGLVLIGVSAFLGGVIALEVDKDDAPAEAVVQQTPTTSSPAPVNQATGDIASLYDAVRDSVVRVSGQGAGGAGGLGSGVVIDKDGHILTNNHVVDGMNVIDVRFADGSAYSAEVLGTDPGNDLAIIKVDVPADKLTPASLGDSDAVRVGETVIAIGNPFDIEGTLTQGIVSGLGRVLTSDTGRPMRQLIQSDAAINPGNSGGGLFNDRGELIGITSAIENPSGDRVFVGIGYAVPINTAKRFLPELLAGGEIEHPRLGVTLDRDVTPAVDSELGLGVDYGVLIRSVEPNSAAAAAGLRGSGRGANGDVIIGMDGEEVRDFNDLAELIDVHKIGDTVEVKFVRDGEEQTVQVVLEAWNG